MRILFIHSSGNQIAGSEMVLLNMLENLNQHFQKRVLLPERGVFQERLRKSGILTYTRPFSPFYRKKPWSYLKHLKNMAEVIQKVKPDLIHTTSASPIQYAYPLSRWFRIPLVCHIQCPYQSDDMRRYFPYRSDKVVLIANNLKNSFAPHYQHKLEVIYNGIQVHTYDRLQMKKRLTDQYNLPKEAPLIGMVGQIINRKGVDLLLKSMKQVLAYHPTAQVLIVGNYHNLYGTKMMEFAADLGIKDHIHWAGFQDNVQEIMAGMDILTVPSRKEGFGLVAAEALAVGTPVIASNTGGLQEIIDPQQNGFLITPEDIGELTQSISSLILCKNLRQNMGYRGRHKVQQKFSVKRNIDALQSLYMELMPQNKKSQILRIIEKTAF